MLQRQNFRKSIHLSWIGFLLLILASALSSVQGAAEIQAAPLNPDFINYRTHLNMQRANPGGNRFGAIPAPVDLSYLKSWLTKAKSLAGYPSQFDLRTTGKVTSVKNQSTSGSCWTFATYGSLESNLLPAETRDFSENNLKNTHGFDLDPNNGGNYYMSTAYLARWGGPVNETDDPFDPDSVSSPAGKPVQKHIQEVDFLPDNDQNTIKDYLMNYGAVGTTMYISESSPYYNSATSSYYYDSKTDTNHAVTIVGWNDTYSRYNFGITPPGDGAYIVKNSWGTGWGDHGYFYVSYYDQSFLRYNAVFINAESTANYQRIYQYDPLGWVNSFGYTSGTTTIAWMANIFTAAASEPLVAASWYTNDSNVAYQLDIYTNVTGLPTSGTLAASQTGTITASGYHTIPLTSPVRLTAGTKFGVVVKLANPSYPAPMAWEYAIVGWSSKATSQPGESFVSPNGINWQDLTSIDSTANVCIKAFTAVPLAITEQPASQTVTEGGTATFRVAASGTPPLGYQWKFNGADIPGATSATYAINNVRPADAGSYTVLVTDKNSALTSNPAVLTVQSLPTPTLTITEQPASQTVTEGGTATFRVAASGTPPLGYQWKFNGADIPGATSATYTINNVRPADAGSYTVLVTDKNSSLTSNPAVLTVRFQPPLITKQPVSQTADEGVIAYFNVTATGTSLQYQWQFNGVNIPGATSATLAINPVQLSNAGSYTVIVNNTQDSVTSKAAVLTVRPRVAIPVFSPESGTFTSAWRVKITCATPGAVIHYTTNGADPTTRNPVVGATGLVTVNKSMTIKAAAWKSGWAASYPKSASYTVTGTVATPAFNVKPGTYYADHKDIAISCATTGATIRYTTDGTEPTLTNGNNYSGLIILTADSTTTIKAKAWLKDWDLSPTATAVYTVTQSALAPVFSLKEGIYPKAQKITISCATSGAIIYYSTDGSDPAIRYTPGAKIAIAKTTTIKAMATKTSTPKLGNSKITSATYAITGTVATPAITPGSTLIGAGQNQQVTIGCNTQGSTIYYTVDGSTPTKNSILYTGPITVNATTTIKAAAFLDNWVPSAVATAKYTVTVAAPTFDPPEGNYNEEQTIHVTCNTVGATVRYSTNGKVPTTASPTVPATGIVITRNTTIIARAFKNGWTASAPATAKYSVSLAGGVPVPVITPASRVLKAGETASITIGFGRNKSDAVIYYTTDGSTPTKDSARYTTPFPVDASATRTIKAKAFLTGWASSAVATATYTGTVPTPTFNIPSGTSLADETVINIICEGCDGAVIRYTTNGSAPTTASPVVPGAGILVNRNMTIKAIAYKTGMAKSAIASAGYIFTGVATPKFSIPGGIIKSSQAVTIGCITSGVTRIRYTTDKSDPTPTNGIIYKPGTKLYINSTVTFKAKAWKGEVESAIGSAAYTYTGTVAKPVLSLGAGSFAVSQTVTITCATGESRIYYTVNGAEPSPTNGTLINSGGSVLIDTKVTLKAKAFKDDWLPSPTATAAYTLFQVAAPVVSPEGGIFTGPQTVTVTCMTAGAALRYTINGNDPTLSDPVVGSGSTIIVPVNPATTLKVRAWKTGLNPSPIIVANYQFPLIVTGDGKGSTTPSGGVPITYGAAISITATPNANYHFVNWTKIAGTGTVEFGDANSADTTVKVTGGYATIRANFAINQYTLTITGSGNGNTFPSGAVTVNHGAGTNIAAIPATGYHFINWEQTGGAGTVVFDNANAANTNVTVTGGNAAIRANFAVNQYTLTVTDDGNGNTSPSGATTVTHGASYPITATPNPGYQFVNWTQTDGAGRVVFGDSNSATTTAVVTGDDAVIRANFAIPLNTWVTGNIAPGGYQEYCFKASIGTQYTVGWDDSRQGSSNYTCDVSVSAHHKDWMTAYFSDIDSGYDYPQIITALEDYVYIYVRGFFADSSGSFAIKVAPALHTLTVINDGGGSVNPSGAVTVTDNVSTPIAAVPNTDYQFLKWTKTGGAGTVIFGDVNSADTTATLLGGDATIRANFSFNPIRNTIAVAGGFYHSLAIKNDGTVWAWGYNGNGQLGNGSNTNSSIPVRVNGLDGVIAVAGGFYHSLAIKNDGTVWAWGNNGNGQLGNGSNTDSYIPVKVNGLDGITAIAGGTLHSLALRNDGTVWAWGNNGSGQLGNGSNTDSYIPVQVNGLNGVIAIAGGYSHNLALRNDGTVWAWGDNSHGQLGNATFTSSNIPVQVSGLNRVIAIDGGHWVHSLALRNDGTVWAWGYNSYGQLGNGSTTDSNIPVQVSGLNSIIAIAGGGGHSLALKNDGTVRVWGRNDYGQLGNGSNADSTIPVQVYGLKGIISIAGGFLHGMALKNDGTLWAWGDNEVTELGNNSNTGSNTPVQVGGPSPATAPFQYALTITNNGYGSTAPSGNIVVNDGVSMAVKATPKTGYQFVNWTKIAGAGTAVFGDANSADTTVTVTGGSVMIRANFKSLPLQNVSAIAGGARHSLVLKTDGTVWAWGGNSYGQLGNGSNTSSNFPVQVNGLNGVTSVAGGFYHSLAIKNDGTVWAWGQNDYGQLGNESNTSSNIPVKVNGLNGITAIAGGFYHSLALKNDGTVWAWGHNNYGQLGNGLNTDSNIPVQVSGLNGVVAIAAGYSHSLAIKNDGTVWAWGWNNAGQLGNGLNTNSNVPVQVSGLNGTIAVTGGLVYSMAVKNDGTVWAWGGNGYGQLGNGSNTSSNIPMQVSGLNVIINIDNGMQHSLAIKNDGTVWAWGWNDNGQLGNGSNTDSNIPTSVNGLNGIVAISCGETSSLAIKNDGTVWAWGDNFYGQLGNGSVTGSNIPMQVGAMANSYSNALNITDDGHGSTTPSGYIEVDRVSTAITATPNMGYQFAGWTKTAGTGTVSFDDANSADTTVRVTGGEATIQANFSAVTDNTAVEILDFSGNSCMLNGFQGKNVYSILSVFNKAEGDIRYNGPLTYSITTNSANLSSLGHQEIKYSAPLQYSPYRSYFSKQMEFDGMLRLKEDEILKKRPPLTAKALKAAAAPPYINEVRQFWIVANLTSNTYQQRSFTCKRINANSYIWLDNADLATTSDSTLNDWSSSFETMLPLLRNNFGNDTDSDNDSHIYIMISSTLNNMCGGYFAVADKFPNAVYQVSNEIDSFFLANYSDPARIEYTKGTLAHEFQHMINFDCHYRHSSTTDEILWLNEAFAGLATYICGYGDTNNFILQDYLGDPSVGLTVWSSTNKSYGISFLFARYLYERYPDKIKQMVDTGNVGITNVEAVTGESFGSLVKDFFRAICLDNTGFTSDPKYQFSTLNLRDSSSGFNGLAKNAALSVGSSASYTVYPYQLLLTPLTNIGGSSSISVTTSDSSIIGGTIMSLNQDQHL